MIPQFTISRRGKVPVIEFPEPLGIGGTVRILVQYCEHFDSIRSEVDLIREHMQQAKDEGAPILKIGDHWLQKMQLPGHGEIFFEGNARCQRGEFLPKHPLTHITQKSPQKGYLDRLNRESALAPRVRQDPLFGEMEILAQSMPCSRHRQ